MAQTLFPNDDGSSKTRKSLFTRSHRPGARRWFVTSFPVITVTRLQYYLTHVVYIGEENVGSAMCCHHHYLVIADNDDGGSNTELATVLQEDWYNIPFASIQANQFIFSEKTTSCFECQWFSYTILGKEACFFVFPYLCSITVYIYLSIKLFSYGTD